MLAIPARSGHWRGGTGDRTRSRPVRLSAPRACWILPRSASSSPRSATRPTGGPRSSLILPCHELTVVASRRISATPRCRRKVAIEAGLCRSGRTGGAPGAVAGRPLGRSGRGRQPGGKSGSARPPGSRKPRCTRTGVVVEAAPAAALEVAQAQLLLQLLEVALDPPAQPGGRDQVLQRGRLGQGREPVLRRPSSPSGHSARNHSSARGSPRRKSSCAAGTAPPRSGRPAAPPCPAPGDGPPGVGGQARRQPLGREGLVLRVRGAAAWAAGPFRDHGAAGSGPAPGGHRPVVPRMPAT